MCSCADLRGLGGGGHAQLSQAGLIGEIYSLLDQSGKHHFAARSPLFPVLVEYLVDFRFDNEGAGTIVFNPMNDSLFPFFFRKMKMTSLAAGAACLLGFSAGAESPVTLTVATESRGYAVPWDFGGVSIFTRAQRLNHRGVPGHMFSGSNTQLVTLFRNSGIHHLRLGATASSEATTNLETADIDSLFAFARAANIRVIYSLHQRDGAATAKYIWEHYRAQLDCFALDNEPDGRVLKEPKTNLENYLANWREFVRGVTNAAPGATFAGPDASGRALVRQFVKGVKGDALGLVTQHCYVGGNPLKRGIDAPHAIEHMLSRDWVTNNYPQLFNSVLRPVARAVLPFRLTELNDHVHGVTNVSNAFLSALWALDVMHWWAAHGAAGVNFQNTQWLYTDIFHPDASGDYQIYPKAYALKAFELGSEGFVEPVAVDNPQDLNLTAYAIGNATNLYVTIINKEHGDGRDAAVSVDAKGFSTASATAIFLTAPNGDVRAISGMTLGGSSITNNAPWSGHWTALTNSPGGLCTVRVPAGSAALVKMAARGL